jgi:hypothetical protein
MSEPIYLVTIFAFLGTVVILGALRYMSNLARARAQMAETEAYRVLAERAVAANQHQTDAIAALRADLTAVRNSLSGIEKILKDVG